MLDRAAPGLELETLRKVLGTVVFIRENSLEIEEAINDLRENFRLMVIYDLKVSAGRISG